jgi:hypothetical protein
MKRGSGAQPLVGKPAESPADPADRTPLLPTERPSEKPASGVTRTSRTQPTRSLGAALARIEQGIKVPREVEDRIVARLIGRMSSDTLNQRALGLSARLDAIERGIEVPKDVEDRIVGVIREHRKAERLRAEQRANARSKLIVILLAVAAGMIVLSLALALHHVVQRGP